MSYQFFFFCSEEIISPGVCFVTVDTTVEKTEREIKETIPFTSVL